MKTSEEKKHERELNATLKQIKDFNSNSQTGRFRFRIDIPVWRLAIEGITTFMLAFIVGMGLAVLYKTIVL